MSKAHDGYDDKNIFFGVVEDRNDPLKLGRVRVRIHTYHSEDKTKVPTDMLPWVPCLHSVMSACHEGIGLSPTGLLVGSTVKGMFLDGEAAQQPIVTGTYAGTPNGKSDISALATGEEKLTKGVAPLEPNDVAKPQYPQNLVFDAECGSAIEVDSTPGAERISAYHKSGSYIEMRPDGGVTLRSVTNNYQIILKDDVVYVGGNVKINVQGNVDMTVGGTIEAKAKGAVNISSATSVTIKAPSIELSEESQTVDAKVEGQTTIKPRKGHS